jgi:hypothetical protein
MAKKCGTGRTTCKRAKWWNEALYGDGDSGGGSTPEPEDAIQWEEESTFIMWGDEEEYLEWG